MRTIALALALFSLAAGASAVEINKSKKTAKADKELEVRGLVNIKDTCESREPPEINLDIPPKGGTICVKRGMVRLGETWSGRNQHCIGKRIAGVFVIYKSFAGFTGLDTVRYTASVPSDARTYEVEIRVEPGHATGPRAGSAASEPQKAGPMPPCPALVALSDAFPWSVPAPESAGSDRHPKPLTETGLQSRDHGIFWTCAQRPKALV